MSEKVINFLEIVGAQFNKRFQSEHDRRLWVSGMVHGLGHYDANVLERAAYYVVNNRTEPGFPRLAECHEACQWIISVDKAKETKPLDPNENKNKASPGWAAKLADELICAGSLGKRAARENWILSLHDFCREKGRLPTEEYEIKGCIKAARGFDEAYEQVLNGNGGAMTKALETLGDSMMRKRERLRTMVLGPDA